MTLTAEREQEIRERVATHGLPENTISQFWSRADRRSDDECWPWKGSASRRYGILHVAGRNRKATQISWEIETGLPFPAGKMACHSCDNPNCVNPNHLWPGTMKENMHDCISKGRFYFNRAGQKRQFKTVCVNGHAYTPENSKINSTGHTICRICDRPAKTRWEAKDMALRAARNALGGDNG